MPHTKFWATIDGDVLAKLDEIEQETGWKRSQSVEFLLRAGIAAVSNSSDQDLKSFRELIAARRKVRALGARTLGNNSAGKR
jgi:metal-responsive CopG/Arc/MetJ family transcriptional regulator